MSNYTWSYSSISLFQQCPRKYYRLRVIKDIVEPPQEHLLYGSAVHKAAEEYVRDNTPIPEKFAFMKPHLDLLKSVPGEKFCEYEMGLTREFEPCAFKAPEVWMRGIADLLIIKDDKAKIVDYKTSKSSRYADTKQLELLSLLVFKHFPQIKKVKAGLVFLVAEDVVGADYDGENQKAIWSKWLPELSRLEKSYEADVWNPRPNFTCKNYCPVKDCEHNGRN